MSDIDEHTRCQSPDPLECDNQNNHPHACHCDNPSYWRKKCADLEQRLEAMTRPVTDAEWRVFSENKSHFALKRNVVDKLIASRAHEKERQ